MSVNWQHAWVTVAVDDWESLTALVLARSLRRVLSTKRIVIIISKEVSQNIRKLLEEEFDVVWRIYMDTDELGSVKPEVYIRAQCWKLTLFKKCVFLNPDLMVVKNCDELFDLQEPSSTTTISVHADKLDLSLFAFTPSHKTYAKLETFCSAKKVVNGKFEDTVELCFGEHNKKLVAENYNANINTKTNYSPDFISNIKCVSFTENRPLTSLQSKAQHKGSAKLNDFGMAVHNLWISIFFEDVHPTIPKDTLKSMNLPLISENSELHFLGYDPLSADTYESMSETVAIIGLSCKFPSANNTEEFWKLLVEGKDCMREVPHERWDTSRDPKKTIGGFIDAAVDEFDAKFFGISPREAIVMDPQQRFLLESTWEALENAGINPQELKGTTTGVFMGFWNQDYQTILKVGKATNDFLRSYLGNAISASSARVSFFLGCNGPNMATESGCSSALLALHLACQSLQRKDCNLAVSGGINLILVPYTPHNQAVAHVLAPDGHCKTFDEKADGFGRGEGCGVIVLKRLSDAIRDDDNILALVRASAFNQEGTTSSFGTPSKYCQEKVIEKALRDGNIQPQDVTYVEAHGTGTLVGDPIEVAAIGSAYAKGRDEPLMIGSVKTNIGHSESAAGIAGLIKVVLSLQHQTIPPHINFQTLNPYINLEETPVTIPVEPTKWVGNKQGKRLGALNSFGMSGTNVHVILEEAPKIKKFNPLKTIYKNEAPQHLLNISAKTETALNELIDKYRHLIKKNPELSLNDICYTANVGRARFAHRASIVAKDLAQMETLLDKKQVTIGKSLGVLPKIGFLFTGQGSQYNGMAKQLYQTHPVFRTALDKCSTILQNNCNERIFDVMWHDEDTSRLDQTMFSQTAIFCIEYSLIQLWKSFGVEPDIVFGHSVGEFAAAAAAGVLSLEDALKLVSERSKLIQELPTGGMMAVKASSEVVESLIDSVKKADSKFWLDIAVVNSEDEVVVAGRPEALDKLGLLCNESDPPVKSQRLAATHAFHSRDMETILPVYGKIAETVTNNVPKCGYISGATGKLLEASEFNSKYWQKHARDPVNFKASMETLFEQGVRIFIEVGPQPILLALGMTNLSGEKAQESVWIPSIRKTEEEWVTVFTSISKLFTNGFDINWKDYYSIFPASKVLLPNYPFQRQKYWVPITDAFNLSLLHPLLGKSLSLVTNDSFYEHNLNLDWLPYLNDHKVADKFIVPGAGLLEMILASGHIATSGYPHFVKPSNTLVVEDFSIEAALEIDPDRPCRTQVVVSKAAASENKEVAPAAFEVSSSQSPEMEIGVYHKDNDVDSNTVWRRHARGRFTAYTSLTPSEPVDIESIRKRCNIERKTSEVYSQTKVAGVYLGPCFQSLVSFWKGSNEIFAEISCNQDTEQYICHPIILDALIQIFACRNADESKGVSGMAIPIGLDQFILYPHEKPEKLYGYIRSLDELSNSAVTISLLNENGEEIAVMKNVRLVLTSVTAFMNALTYHKRDVTGLYENVFRHKLGPTMSRVNLSEVVNIDNLAENEIMAAILEESQQIYDEFSKPYILLNRTVYCTIIYSLYDLGFDPKVNEIIQLEDFVARFEISPHYDRLISRFLDILAEEGILKIIQNGGVKEWQVVFVPKFDDDLEGMIYKAEKDLQTSVYKDELDVKLVLQVTKKLPQILQGKHNPLSVLFPNEGEGISASTFYTDTKYLNQLNVVTAKVLEVLFSHVTSKTPGEVLRILEVGAGTGGTTKSVIALLQEKKIPYTYNFTDLSPHFLSEAKIAFKDISLIDYNLLNIETDPKSQNFPPHHYDIIFASNVIHATEKIEDSVRHIRHLLAPGGIFVISETLDKIRHIDLIFGILPQYFRFKDLHLRPDHPMLNADQWETVLKANGFAQTTVIYSWGKLMGAVVGKATDDMPPLFIAPRKRLEKLNSASWVIFSNESNVANLLVSRLKASGKNVITVAKAKAGEYENSDENVSFKVDYSNEEHFKTLFKAIDENHETIEGAVFLWGVNEENQEIISRSFLYLSQYLVKKDSKTRLCVVTKGNNLIGDQVVTSPQSATLRGAVQTLIMEQVNINGFLMDIDPEETEDEITVREIMYEIWSNTTEFQIAYRNKKKIVVRLNKSAPLPMPLRIPKTEQYKIQIPESKSLHDLILVPFTKPNVLANDELEIEIRATGLNFRDLFVILKPDLFKYQYDEIGMECSGTVSRIGPEITRFKIGDEVFGLSTVGAISSHAVVKEKVVMHKPKSMTFAQAATLPITFFTAYYCLVDVANIQAGETVLIHVASGGVGLAAIQICKKLGAKIIGTAGSKRKRKYLHDLGIEHVFHSRNDSFGDDIMRVTNGVGVDMVLNSLTGTNMKETSLRCCKPNARFVEMSKIQIWTPEEVKELRPDVAYTIVNLERDLEESDMTGKIQKAIDEGDFSPLPYTQFDVTQTIEAFFHFQKALQIGKIVITMPKLIHTNSKHEVQEKIFNEDSTYLITGGLGGIGMEVTKWMTQTGAKNIVLIGRKEPTPEVQKIIDTLNNTKGKNILTYQVDVGDVAQLQNLLDTIKDKKSGLPPLRGIIHSAGTLSDGIIANQTWEKFQAVFTAKVNGTWNLHNLTKDYLLEHFVLFSSGAALFGPLAQSNHAAANAFLDTFTHYRHSIGLPAQSINWGIWGEVGAAANLSLGKEGAWGVKPFSPKLGIGSLRAIMRHHLLQTAAIEIHDASAFVHSFKHLLAYAGELTDGYEGIDTTVNSAECERFWKEIKETENEKRHEVVKALLEKAMRQTLKLPDEEPIDEHQNFKDMGMDSLMAVEMRNRLQHVFGKYLTLNATSLMDYPNLSGLSNYLAEQTFNIVFDEEGAEEGVSKKVTTKLEIDSVEEELKRIELIKEDSVLPDDIQNVGGLANPSEIKTILLTGATGFLGSYVLSQLSMIPNREIKIICLIRAKSVKLARVRLLDSLKKHGVLDSTNMENVICLYGEISHPKLALSDDVYDNLCSEVDAVVHCAIKANHLEKYKKIFSIHDIRSINVLATVNILRFASIQRSKSVFYPSSHVAANKVDEDGFLAEELPSDDNNFLGIKLGYATSKFVCEKLFRQAIERGIPCKVFRLPSLTGNSVTGHFAIEKNLMMSLFIACCQLGVMPKGNGEYFLVPVDIAAKVCIQLFLDDGAESGLYNIIKPESITPNDLLNLAKDFQYQMKILPVNEFADILKKSTNPLVTPFMELYESEKVFWEFICSTPALKYTLVAGGKSIYRTSNKVVKYIPQFLEWIPHPKEMCRKQIQFSKQTGITDSLNISL